MDNLEPDFLLFAGGGTWGVIAGVIFLALSMFALWRDRRRQRRAQADQLGCIPWTTVSVLMVFAAAAAFLFALKSH